MTRASSTLPEQPPISRPRARLNSVARTFDALRIRNYRIYFTGALLSNVGTWMQRVAQDWLVLELSGGSGLAVGITTALQFLPMLLITPYGGLIADRFDKRAILRVTQSWMAASAGLLGLLAVLGVAETWHVFALAFIFGVGTAFDNPARQAFVSEIVDREHMPNAIGLNSASFNAARIVGPAVAGLVIAAFGSGWAILANAISYLSFIIALAIIDPGRLHGIERAVRGKRQIREGLAYIRGRSDIILVLCIAAFVGTFGLNFQMTSALMAQQTFHKGAGEYGILGTFMAVGSLTGALIGARRKTAPRARFIIGAAVAFALIEVVVGMMPTYWSYAAVLPIMGLASMLTLNASNMSVQMGVDPQLRGRVMAIYMMVMQGGTPIGAPILGWVGEVFGARWTLIGGGGVALLGVLASAAIMARRGGVRISPTFSTRRPWLSLHTRSR
ncbi:MFS transporter [Microlunatus soli]|uniref:Predicted arabinose efflux permease, MFS family n=1 Tax=Microlunatus soli TaxID=630515 RepID=A0A1H1RJJ5_9ACTN|nr:MFS transporter [Microlunatus soli]SDS35696.1 Predicted arabinose efflux permease, MFS family [Microlunatus soli]